MGVVQDIEKLIEPVVAQAGLELVDVQYQREPQGWILRLYLDKPGGFNLTDCEEWNDRVGQVLENSDLIPHSYSLEISSPGLNRPLRKPEDFQRFQGIDVVVKLFAAQNGQKNFHGRIAGVENGELVLEDRTSGTVRVPLASVASARLDPPVEL